MKRIILLVSILIIGLTGYCQNDTIRLNQSKAATLEYGSEIKFAIFGNNPMKIVNGQQVPVHYDHYKNGKVMIISAMKEEIPEMTLTVSLANGKMHHHILKLSDNPKKNVYSYVNKKEQARRQREVAEKKMKEAKEERQRKAMIRNKIKETMNHDNTLKSIAAIKGRVIIAVGNVASDDSLTYVKLIISNRSANNYRISATTFQYVEYKKKWIQKDEVKNSKRVSIVDEISHSQVESGNKKVFGFAIPQYSTDQGNLVIKVLENKGERDVELRVNINDISSEILIY